MDTDLNGCSSLVGMKAGPSYHDRYFQLKGFDGEKKKQFIQERRGAYTAWVPIVWRPRRVRSTDPSYFARFTVSVPSPWH